MFSYDVVTQLGYMQGQMSTHHPILHTLMLDLFINKIGAFAGSANTGLLAYSVFQIVVFAAQMAYAVLFIYRCNVKNA